MNNKLKIKYGTFEEEKVEQKMSKMFINSKDIVLELGSNIGRNSLVIANILENSSNLVTLETDIKYYNKCIENRDLNNFKFNCVNKALSYRKLYSQFNKEHGKGGGFCVPNKYNIDYKECEIITLEDLEKKYNLVFNTLVCDCEGGLYYILKDNLNLLKNIKKILLENDFSDIKHKEYVNKIFILNNFKRVYYEKLDETNFPCKEYFWETWIKIN